LGARRPPRHLLWRQKTVLGQGQRVPQRRHSVRKLASRAPTFVPSRRRFIPPDHSDRVCYQLIYIERVMITASLGQNGVKARRELSERQEGSEAPLNLAGGERGNQQQPDTNEPIPSGEHIQRFRRPATYCDPCLLPCLRSSATCLRCRCQLFDGHANRAW